MCRKQRLDSWVIRLTHESTFYKEVSFVTLTYNDFSVPLSSLASPSSLPRYTLCKKDLQDFFKRLRKRLGKEKKIKYYACGEYGGKTGRPHYHVIIFGCSDFKVINQSWAKGFIKVLPFDISSIRYIAGYIQKTGRTSDIVRSYKSAGLQPPFKTQSTGIGKRYAIAHDSLLRTNLSVFHFGRRYSIPRYYRKLLGISELHYETLLDGRFQSLFIYFLERYPLENLTLSTFDGQADIRHFKPYLDKYYSSLKLKELELQQKFKFKKFKYL
ncbi:replication initiator protein [Dipodfec virus UOA04_Rod_1057]|nr:replication initiator protein [Dipodfec virus UOA04_Rod_1057]